MTNKNNLENIIVEKLKTIVDPEIAINIYDLGLIYKIDISKTNDIVVDMTFTAPNCAMSETLLAEVKNKLNSIPEINSLTVNIVFEPAWNPSMMSDEAKFNFELL